MLAAIALPLAAWSGPAVATGQPVLDPSRLGWQRVELEARKLFLSASAGIEVGFTPAACAAPGLAGVVGAAPLPPRGTVARMRYSTDGAGRRADIELVMNATDGAALQRTQLDSGKRQRRRLYRFTDQGAFHYTRRPASEEEAALTPADWSDLSSGMREFAPPADGAVIDPAGLFYVLAAAPLLQPGDEYRTYAFSRKQLHEVRARVSELAEADIDYAVDGVSAGGKRRVLRIIIDGETLDGADDEDNEDDFELLGLRGRIELLMDPQTRAPLQLEGRVKILGNVRFRVRSVGLAQAAPQAEQDCHIMAP